VIAPGGPNSGCLLNSVSTFRVIARSAGPPFSPWLSILAHPAMVAVKQTNNAEALSGLDLFMVCSFMFN
jgi:hypothetical protein